MTVSKIGATNTPTTMDYSTLAAWIAACPADLTVLGANTQWIGEQYNQGTFTVSSGSLLTISGQTTDALHNIILRCATGQGFIDAAGPLLYSQSTGAAMRTTGTGTAPAIGTDYTLISGIQYQHGGGYGSAMGIFNNVTFERSIHDSNSSPLFVGVAIGQNLLITTHSGNGVARGHIYNCTVIQLGSGGSAGLNDYGSTLFIQNNAFFGFTGLIAGGNPIAGSDYNATDLATSFGTGTHNLNSLTFASQFVSTTTDFRAVSTGGLKAGTPDATHALVDIYGTIRSLVTPYIGCFEVTGAATVGAIKLGSTAIKQLYLGSTQIKKAYLGSTVVYTDT